MGNSIESVMTENDVDGFLNLVSQQDNISLSYLIDAGLAGADMIVGYILQNYELAETENLVSYLNVKLGTSASIKYPELIKKILDFLSEAAYDGTRNLLVYHWSSGGIFNYIIQFDNHRSDDYIKLINNEIIGLVKSMANWSDAQLAECLSSVNINLRYNGNVCKEVEQVTIDESSEVSSKQFDTKSSSRVAFVSEKKKARESKYVKNVLTIEERLRVAGFDLQEVIDWACKREGYI